MESDLNESSMKETEVKCLFHTSEYVNLFCMECQDAICVQCLLKSHQKHSVQSIKEAQSSLEEKVRQWYSEKESTLQAISKMKQNLDEKLKRIDELETESHVVLMNCEQKWKKKLAEEIESQSSLIRDHFSQNRKDLQALISEISFSGNEIENFDPKSETDSCTIRLYCNIKECITGDVLSKINIVPPTLELNENIDVNIGTFKPGLKVSTDRRDLMKEQTLNIKLIEDGNSCYKKVSIQNIKRHLVSKIIPTSDDKAWLIVDRKLYDLNLTEIGIHLVKHDVDDIALLENGDLFILNRQSTFIHQMNKDGELSPFTCTDPYAPLCMDFVVGSNTLMIWMSQKDTRHITLFGLNGIKKKSFTLPASHSACSYMSAQACNNFAIIYNVKQTTGLRNYVYSYNIEPTSYKSFSGTFGCSPYLQFVCKGICYDTDGALLVSDFQFNSVYKVDRKMQFEKIILDKNAGLESPTALAFKDGLLWVADANHITIFKYKDL